MIKNEEYVNNVDSIFDDVKFASNSFIRLKILATLYDKPQNMKELTETTNLSYSSISSNMHEMELKNFVYRENNKYFLTNSAKVRIADAMEFNGVIKLLNDFFNIIDSHVVDLIPVASVCELHLLGKANLMESSGVDAYRTYNFIDKCLAMADHVTCVLPFYYEPFFNNLDELASRNKEVELLVPEGIFEKIEETTKIRNLDFFTEEDVFLLIITDQVMILGLFMENGYFDQNRLITSKNENSILWAYNLFENFKKEVNELKTHL